MKAPGHIKKPDQNVILVGPLRFELKSQDPQSCRMDQATLRPRRADLFLRWQRVFLARHQPTIVIKHVV